MEAVIKMSHICLIQQLQDAADVRRDNYDDLEAMSLEDLETERDRLIKVYNRRVRNERSN